MVSTLIHIGGRGIFSSKNYFHSRLLLLSLFIIMYLDPHTSSTTKYTSIHGPCADRP